MGIITIIIIIIIIIIISMPTKTTASSLCFAVCLWGLRAPNQR